MNTKIKQNKSKIITFRVTEEEEEFYKKQAEIAGLSLSEYICRKLKGSKIVAKQPVTDRQTIATLRQIGGLIKQLFKYEKIIKIELDNALKKIYSVISQINKLAGNDK